MQTSQPSSHTSSATALVERSQSTKSRHALGTNLLKSALKKPFQGWSKDLLRAKDNDDDDYNFTSGARRGAEHCRNGD
ncbi:uncharacterized protein K460DRAFT_288330 [Cucurbitaria berberidis CBS 394.84]|uniref:Uncharacterized protein n=1 Tax=Cucurbitaria berberidis CBS 394.84 TaxID=1168544 RepID=A0A9P4GEQ7_9PLEO|nr:uncharacterized protein K460DRAFT_288330 [Cucurbitaria berberidis CBS 394.84]KAF1844262.1 hypothetical protein K460DRAFT_288330 [Cucurbitaria berberidis CBS 394.84]